MPNYIPLATNVDPEISKLVEATVLKQGFKNKSEWLRMVVHKELGVAYSPLSLSAPTLGEYIRSIVRDELSREFEE